MTHPRAVQTMGVCTLSIAGISRLTWPLMRRWMDVTRGLSGPGVRCPRSKPEQKCSPLPVRWMTRTSSSLAAASIASVSA